MTTNARKWQGKFNELQRVVEDETCHREEMQSKLYMAEKRVGSNKMYLKKLIEE